MSILLRRIISIFTQVIKFPFFPKDKLSHIPEDNVPFPENESHRTISYLPQDDFLFQEDNFTFSTWKCPVSQRIMPLTIGIFWSVSEKIFLNSPEVVFPFQDSRFLDVKCLVSQRVMSSKKKFLLSCFPENIFFPQRMIFSHSNVHFTGGSFLASRNISCFCQNLPLLLYRVSNGIGLFYTVNTDLKGVLKDFPQNILVDRAFFRYTGIPDCFLRVNREMWLNF